MSREASLNAHGAAPAGDQRPENPTQIFEKVESAPGMGTAALRGAGTGPAFEERRAFKATPPDLPGESRPENPPQGLDNLESAPGNGGLS
jgi:hypothetical protein